MEEAPNTDGNRCLNNDGINGMQAQIMAMSDSARLQYTAGALSSGWSDHSVRRERLTSDICRIGEADTRLQTKAADDGDSDMGVRDRCVWVGGASHT